MFRLACRKTVVDFDASVVIICWQHGILTVALCWSYLILPVTVCTGKFVWKRCTLKQISVHIVEIVQCNF